MEAAELEKLFVGAAEIGVELTKTQLAQFDSLGDLLTDWNQRMNLTRIPPEEYVPLHFLDSLLALKAVNMSPRAKVIDVGTGAGFPGIPLKIARPDLHVTFLDSTRKKLSFVDHCCSELDLRDCQTLHSRAEDAAKLTEHARKYDFAFARAVARLDMLAGWLLPFVKSGGAAVALKSSDADGEIAEAGALIKQKGGITKMVPGIIPGTEIARTLIVIFNRRR